MKLSLEKADLRVIVDGLRGRLVCPLRMTMGLGMVLLASPALGNPRVQASTDRPEREDRTDIPGEPRAMDPLGATVLAFRDLGMSLNVPPELVLHKPDLLYAALVRDGITVRIGERGRSVRSLTPSEREALFAALAGASWNDLRLHLKERLEAGPESSERLIAIGLLGALGNEEDLGALVRWAEPARPHQRVSREVRTTLGSALASIVERHPVALRSLPGLMQVVHRSSISAVLAGLRAVSGAPALAALTDSLGRVPAADALVLAEISEMARSTKAPIDARIPEMVCSYVNARERAVRIEAVTALGCIGSAATIPMLLELLDAKDFDMRERALSALRTATGQSFQPDRYAWAQWLRSVKQWRQTDGPRLKKLVMNGSIPEASRAILELCNQRIYRHSIAADVARGLERREAELVTLACTALGQLDSTVGVDPLLAKLKAPDPSVRRAAFLALRRITDEDHGEDPSAWRAAGW